MRSSKVYRKKIFRGGIKGNAPTEEQSHEQLPEIIKKNHSIYCLVDSTESVAIYEQYQLTWDRVEFIAGYEVFKIQIQNERWFNGKLFPRKELFPHNETFGIFCLDLPK